MFTNPAKNLKALDLHEGMIVADLGAGSGFYSVAAAKMIGSGKVYAVEIDRDFLETVKNRARDEKLSNIECFWGDVEQTQGTKIRDHVVDRVITSNIFSQIQDHENFIKEIKRILKPAGKVLFVDWSPGLALTDGKNDITVSKKKVEQLFINQGFIWTQDIDAGSNHYGMIFQKQ